MKKEYKAGFFDRSSTIYFLLIAIPALLYIKSLWFGFSPLDEQWLIIKNPHFLERWENVKEAFLQPTAGVYYRPLFIILLIINYHLGQLEPFAYHFSSLALHLIMVVVLYRFLLSFNADKKAAFWLTLAFAVHPVLLHAVAWVPGSNDLVLGIAILSSLLFLQKYMKERKVKFLIAHLIAFIAALLTKENAVVLPLVFAMLFSTQKEFSKKESVRLGLFWFAILIGWYTVRTSIVTSYTQPEANLFSTIQHFFEALFLFTGKAVLPIQQSVYPTLNHSSVIPGIISAGLLVLAWFKPEVKNKRYALIGLVLFFSLLIIPAWFSAYATSREHYEHRVYTSLAGLMLFVSQLKFDINKKFSYVLAIVCLVFSVKTFIRMDVYRDKSSFLEAGIEETPDYFLFYTQKADLLFETGQYEEAISNYSKAIALRPNFIDIYNNRGHIYIASKKYPQAISDYSSSINIKPNKEAYINRCIAYANSNDLDKAVKDLLILQKQYPGSMDPTIARDIMKRWSLQSLNKLNTQIAANPENAGLYIDRAKLYMSAEQPDKALSDVQKACALEPQNQFYRSCLKQFDQQQ